MLKFYRKCNKQSQLILLCVPHLVIIKYFGNNTIEIKRIVLTYPDLLASILFSPLIQLNPSLVSFILYQLG